MTRVKAGGASAGLGPVGVSLVRVVPFLPNECGRLSNDQRGRQQYGLLVDGLPVQASFEERRGAPAEVSLGLCSVVRPGDAWRPIGMSSKPTTLMS